ncbi:MAG: DUF3810 domain-containing protein [Oscillospiraceae bacterium]|nr:DUF3810 domain-containing protein [Oscillospiraceae bacterium]
MDIEKNETGKKWKLPSINLPRGVIIAICSLPVVLIGVFYALRSIPSVMGWVAFRVSAPIRGLLGMLSSIYPFSITEILITVAIIWVIFYSVKTIMVTARRRGKLRILARRLLPVFVAAAYIWGLFCWLWNSGYYAPGFAERHGFSPNGVAISDLAVVASLFAEKANELAPLMLRDENGHYIADRRGVFAASMDIYRNIALEFPDLGGRTYAPKSMMFSWLMSRTGYSGVYFALTGEANINTRIPAPFLPTTVAHEHSHQLGVFAEDEANFVGIAACVTSGNAVFEYSGYISGLGYLLSALHDDDPQSWIRITVSLSNEVWIDWRDNDDYWESQRRVKTGVEFLDNILTSVTQGVSDAVDAVYDSFLKSQNQTLGLKSYGACVDMLVEYFIA